MTDLVKREQSQPMERMDGKQLQYISSTEFIPKHLRGNMPAIMACVATGRELGLGDMEALRSIYVVDGRPTLSAELMVRLVRKRGHSITGDFAAESCTVTGKRRDNGDTITVTWTRAMAQQAGLLGKDNWKKYEPAMLWSRAVSQLCRMLFGDVLTGVHYSAEELEDGVDEFGGPLDNLPPVDRSAFNEPEPQPVADEDAGPGEVVPDDAVPDDGGSLFGRMAEQAQAKKAGRHE